MHHHMHMINMHPQQVVKPRKYHHERSTEEVCWGGEDEEEHKDGEGEVCEREGESRSTVTYVWVVLHACVYLELEGRMMMGMRVEGKVSDSGAR